MGKHPLNLALRFILEITALVVFAIWGWNNGSGWLGAVLAIGLPVFFVLVAGCSHSGNDSSEWRGPNREGVFYETGLLQSWPENGPEMLWSVDGLGTGHGCTKNSTF